MATVELFHWNPRVIESRGRMLRRLPLGRRVNNFGDLLGPEIVRGMLSLLRLDAARAVRPTRLLSVGSVVHLAAPGDTIWGSGVNGHWLSYDYRSVGLDIRAVRGPRTREFLAERGVGGLPQIYGDPALLLNRFRPDLVGKAKRHEVTYVPNLNEAEVCGVPDDWNTMDPRSPLERCLTTIAESKFVTGSSLHAIVVAESLGIPARVVRSSAESDFKYEDYYAGTGRDFEPAESTSEAVRRDGQEAPRWDAEALIDAFPADLWRPVDGAEPSDNRRAGSR